jgi:hypothetical protein
MKHLPNFIKIHPADAHDILLCVIFLHDMQTMPVRGYNARANATPIIFRTTILNGAWDGTTIAIRSVETNFL